MINWGKLLRRKRYIINPGFQYRFIARMMVLSMAVLSVIYGANLMFFWRFIEKGRGLGLPEEHVFFKFIAAQKQEMNIIFICCALGVLTILLIGGILLSHRVAGPLYRLNHHMLKIANGSPATNVSFRKGDYFQELPVAFNQMLQNQAKTAPAPSPVAKGISLVN